MSTRTVIRWNLRKLMAENGYVGLDIPPEYGGLGLDTLSCAIILEEISSAWFSAATHSMTLLTGCTIVTYC